MTEATRCIMFCQINAFWSISTTHALLKNKRSRKCTRKSRKAILVRTVLFINNSTDSISHGKLFHYHANAPRRDAIWKQNSLSSWEIHIVIRFFIHLNDSFLIDNSRKSQKVKTIAWRRLRRRSGNILLMLTVRLASVFLVSLCLGPGFSVQSSRKKCM